MAENGCAYAVVESSSHGLSPKTNRLGDVGYDAAVFTNLGHEHLEFHGTWEQYRDDKVNLFRALNRNHAKTEIAGSPSIPEPFGVVNADDPNSGFFSGVTGHRTNRFSATGKDSELAATDIENDASGNTYNVSVPCEKSPINIHDSLPGAFNVDNLLAAMLAVTGLTGFSMQEIAPLCPKLEPVRGRMTAVKKNQPFEVYVDFAHTPSAFLAILPPLRKRVDKTGGRIISLFGSSGERDTEKRPKMGKAAAEYSDIIILTEDDPRKESPLDIINEIARGVFEVTETEGKKMLFKQGENLFIIPDRREAIRKAVSVAKPGDIVLLLGKGHQDTMIYGDSVLPYDEINEAEKVLEELQ